MSFDRVLKYIVYTSLFLVLFVPVYVTGALFFPYITGKAFMFRILVELGFGAWLILALRNPEYRPQKSWLMFAMSIFVGVIAIADIFGGHFLKSFWSNFERMEGLVTLVHLLAYFFVLISFVNTEQLWHRLMQTSIAASLISGGWGFFQLFGFFASSQSGTRLDGSFGNASYMAVYMLFHIFIAAYLYSRTKKGDLLRYVYPIIILFESIILIFTQTRGTILGFVGALALTALLVAIFEREDKRVRKIATISLGTVAAVIILFFALKNTPVVQNTPPLKRVADISLTERTTASRFLIWDMAYQGFKEKPIIGWGQENFIFVFEKYYHPAMYSQEPWFDRAHNVFFDWLVAGGILGLLSYLSLFAFALLYLWKNRNLTITEKSIFTAIFAGYFIHNLFVFDNIGSYLMFVFILSFIHFKKAEDDGVEKTGNPVSSYQIFTSAIIILTIFSLYFFNVKGILVGKTLLQALSPQQEGVERNLEYYKKALSYNTYGNQEIREQLLSATNSVINLDVPQELKEQFATLSRDEMLKQIETAPDSARAQIFMGSFLNRVKLYDQAIPFLETALELSPKKQSIYFELVTNYLNSGQTSKAVEFAKKAYELDKTFDAARTIYATALIYDKQVDLAESVIEERFGEKIIADEKLARAYFETGEIQKSIASWTKLIEQSPDNLQYRMSLGATYLGGGMRQEAIAEIQKAIEVNPAFKEQGEFFIKEIQAGRNP